MEILKNITEVQPAASDEKYKVVSPETMQEAAMTDSEDEGGKYRRTTRLLQSPHDVSAHVLSTWVHVRLVLVQMYFDLMWIFVLSAAALKS